MKERRGHYVLPAILILIALFGTHDSLTSTICWIAGVGLAMAVNDNHIRQDRERAETQARLDREARRAVRRRKERNEKARERRARKAGRWVEPIHDCISCGDSPPDYPSVGIVEGWTCQDCHEYEMDLIVPTAEDVLATVRRRGWIEDAEPLPPVCDVSLPEVRP